MKEWMQLSAVDDVCPRRGKVVECGCRRGCCEGEKSVVGHKSEMLSCEVAVVIELCVRAFLFQNYVVV